MPNAVHVVGLDIAKSVFQIHCADERGRVVVRRQLKGEQVEPFFQALPACLVALEACPGAHHWGRLLRSIGHDVRLIPAQDVRPYVKTKTIRPERPRLPAYEWRPLPRTSPINFGQKPAPNQCGKLQIL
jgi:transposase